MMPRASLRQCGANRPENAGTNTTSPLSGPDRVVARVHEHEAASPVRALALARLEAGLPEERRVLVAQIARDRDPGQVADAPAVDLGRRPDPGEHRFRDAHRVEQRGLPGE